MNLEDILVVSDFDNTLTGEGHKVPQINTDTILEFEEKGGTFVIGSGRGRDFLRRELSKVRLNGPCVISNGAVIYDYEKEETLKMYAFSEEEREKLIRISEAAPSDVLVTLEQGYDVMISEESYQSVLVSDPQANVKYPFLKDAVHRPLREILSPWIKIGYFGTEEEMKAVREQCEKTGLNGQMSLPFLYELQPSGINKGTAARRLAQLLGKKCLVCIGDAPNDTAMLKEADLAFVPSDASDEMKAMGFRICASSIEGAVADVLNKLMQETDYEDKV